MVENFFQKINQLELFLNKKKNTNTVIRPKESLIKEKQNEKKTTKTEKEKESVQKERKKSSQSKSKENKKKSKEKEPKKETKDQEEKKKLPVNKDGILRVNRTWGDFKEFEMKKGSFTQGEIEKVKKTLLDYAYENNLSEEGLLDLITEKQKKGENSAWTKIAECLPERSVQSIHNLCHRLYDPNNYKGAWSTEEEQTLLKLYEEYGPKWLKIAKIVERTPVNVKDKWKQLGGANIKSRVDEKWTLKNYFLLLYYISDNTEKNIINYSVKFVEMDNEDEVIKIDEENSLMYVDKEMKNESNKVRIYNLLKMFINLNELTKLVDEKMEISWSTISNKMKNYSYDDCKNKFYEIKQFFNIDRKCSLKSDIKMVKKLMKFNFDSLEEVDYSYVKNKRDNETNKKQLEDLVKFYDPFGIKNFNETLQKIMEGLESELNKNNDIFNDQTLINKEISKAKKNEKRNNIVDLYREYIKKRNK